jgi:hypothetical protein
LGVSGDFARGGGNAKLSEEFLGLVFVNVHGAKGGLMAAAW